MKKHAVVDIGSVLVWFINHFLEGGSIAAALFKFSNTAECCGSSNIRSCFFGLQDWGRKRVWERIFIAVWTLFWKSSVTRNGQKLNWVVVLLANGCVSGIKHFRMCCWRENNQSRTGNSNATLSRHARLSYNGVSPCLFHTSWVLMTRMEASASVECDVVKLTL